MNDDRANQLTPLTAETPQPSYSLSLQEAVSILKRRWWIIALSVVVCVAGALGYSTLQTPKYEGQILILVGQEGVEQDTDSLSSDVQGLEQITQTVAEVIPTRTVADAVIDELGLDISSEQLLANLTVEQVPETQAVEVTYVADSPQQASEIANTVGDVFSEQVSDISPATSSISATVWERSEVPDEPASPNPITNSLLALAIGAFGGVLLAFLVEQLDNSWRSPEELESMSGVPNLGAIRQFRPVKKKQE